MLMTPTTDDPIAHAKEMLADLQRLIEALDHRVPRLERLGEPQIARDAADLRQRAVSLIGQLERAKQNPTGISTENRGK
jgi:hypothetical protein